MNVMAHQHHVPKYNTPAWSNPHNLPPPDDAAIFATIDIYYIQPCLARVFLQKQPDWMDWTLSGFN